MSSFAGPWIWSPEHHRYYRHVVDANGMSTAEWAPEAEYSTTTSVQTASAQTQAIAARTNSVQESTDPNMAPAAPAEVRNHIRFQGGPDLGWYDMLDSSYRVRTMGEVNSFFKVGRVFAMLWAEPASATMRRGGTENTAVTIGKFGEGVYSQIRRFVVVRVNRQHHFVYACAILTYGGRGTTKPGCNAAEHTIVYLEGTQPVQLNGECERSMTKEPIMITPTDPQESMDPASRLRCGKIYSIEWNVKVKDIGMVSTYDKTKLLRYFAEEQDSGFEIDDDDLPAKPDPQSYYQPSSYYGY